MPFFIGPPPGRRPAVRSARLPARKGRAGGSAAAEVARTRPVGVRPRRNLEAGRRLRGGDGGGRQAGPCRCGAAVHRLLILAARPLPPEVGGWRAEGACAEAAELAAVGPQRNRSAGTGRTRTDLWDFRLRSAHRRARRVAAESRVEDWRVSFRVRWMFRRFRSGPQSGSLDHVSSPRSSNRTCGFPALRSRSCLRPREALRSRCKTRKTYFIP